MDPRAAKQQVLDRCDALWDEEVRFLRDLVRYPSTRGETNGVQGQVADTLRRIGLDVVEEGVDLAAISQLPGFSPAEWSYDGLINVVGTRRAAASGGKSLIFNGHVDVVSAEPLAHWTHDPWGGETVAGRMFGRGASDMKAGIAAMIFATRAIVEAGIELRGDLTLETVIDEECTGNGTLSCLARGHLADAAIVPESMGMALLTAHPGVLWCRITVRGAGAHVQAASSAVNAAEKAFVVIQALRELEREWNRPERRHPSLHELEHPINVNVGTFHAGDWPSSVPELCTLEVRLAYYPGESWSRAEEEVRRAVAEASERDPWLRDHPPSIHFFGFRAEPAIYDPDDAICRVLAANHEQVTGRPIEAHASAATVDNRFFQLYYNMPNACYGPVGGRPHAPDEWVDLESVRLTTRVLAGTVLDWCGVA